MKILSARDAQSNPGRVIRRMVKRGDPRVIPRVASQVRIAPYQPQTPDEFELARVAKEMDKRGVSVEEDEESLQIIQAEIRKYRAEKRQRK